jgi:hypothetical protein
VRFDRSPDCWRRGGEPLGLVSFQGFDRQLELLRFRASFSDERPNSARR